MLKNIFADIPTTLPEERFDTLLSQPGVHIERIVSKGHATPEKDWYDQAWDEWVLLIQGAATVQFEYNEPFELLPGDFLLIPAHTRHRVCNTQANANTIWLTIHLR